MNKTSVVKSKKSKFKMIAKNAIVAVLTVGMLATGLTTAFGAVIEGGDNGSLVTFAKDADLATATIDGSKIYRDYVTNFDPHPSSVLTDQGANFKLNPSDGVGRVGTDSIYLKYTTRDNDPITGQTGKYHPKDGVYALGSFSIDFEDAVILKDGTRKNLRVTMSDITIYVDQRNTIEEKLYFSFYRVEDSKGISFFLRLGGSGTNGYAYGVSYNVDYSIVGGDGNFIFTALGINAGRPDSYGNIAKGNDTIDGIQNYRFGEQLQLKDHANPVYIPGNGKMVTSYTESGNTTLFYNSRTGNYGSNDTYETGFATLTDGPSIGMTAFNSSGTTIANFNHNVGLSDAITSTITSSSGPNGKIETTTTGTIGSGSTLEGGTYDHATKSNNEKRTYDVASGKTVTYRLTADAWSRLDKIYLGATTDDWNSSTGNIHTNNIPAKTLNVTDEGTYSVDGVTYTVSNVVKNPDGDITGLDITFPSVSTANTNREIHVTWEKSIPSGSIDILGVKTMDGRSFISGDEFTFEISGKGDAPMPVKRAVYDSNGNLNDPDEVTKTIAPSSGVKADIDMGTIVYTIDDLDEHKVKFQDATTAQKNAAATWYDSTTNKPLDGSDASRPSGNDYTYVLDKTFTYYITETPKHPDGVNNDTVVKKMEFYVLFDQVRNKILIDGKDATITDKKDSSQISQGIIDSEPVIFTNTYDSNNDWEPEATKILNNRPLERDQFKFYLKAKAETDATWVVQNAPLPSGAANDMATDTLQDVEEDAAANPKGTNDLVGPVSFDKIKFTNELLQKEITKGSAGTNADKVIYWEDGNTVYGPIPDDATATVTVDGTTATVTYADATNAQRAAAEGDTSSSKWQLDGKTYIDNVSLAPDSAKGIYYADSRSFTYLVWEDAKSFGAANGAYTYDTAISEGSAKEVKVTITENNDGTIDVSAGDTPIFTNTYEASGDVALKAAKVLDDRDEFGRDSFKAGDSFTFKVEALDGAPAPANDTVTITPSSGKEATIAFGTISFDQDDLKESGTNNYDAVRTGDGLYQKTFVYKITETAASSGMSKDDKVLLVAITVQEDEKGNMTVVAVNGVDDSTTFDADSKVSFGSKEVNAGKFTNTYQAAGTANIVMNKVLQNGTLDAAQFYFELLDAKSKVVDTQPNDGSGNITFSNLVYNLNQVKADKAAGLCTYDSSTDTYTYSYTVKEIIPAESGRNPDITYDGTSYVVKVKVTDNGKGVLNTVVEDDGKTFTNVAEQIETIDISVKKEWDDGELNGKDGYYQPKTISVQLKADGTEAGPAVALGETNNWTYKWESLPRTNEQGSAIKYTVEEVDIPYGYTTTYKVDGDSTGNDGKAVPEIDCGTIDSTQTEVKVTAINTPDVEALTKICLVIEKVDKVTGKPVKGAVFTLTDDNDETVGTYTTDASGVAVIAKEDLEVDDADTDTAKFILTETTTPDGYKEASPATSYEIKINKNDIKVRLGGSQNIFQKIYGFLVGQGADYNADTHILKVENEPETYDVIVEKIFAGLSDSVDPATYFKNFKITAKYTDSNKTEQNKELKLSDATKADRKYTWTISNVPYGTEVTATESGMTADGYDLMATSAKVTDAKESATYSADHPEAVRFTMDNKDAKAVFTNTYTKQTGDLELVKIWDDDNDHDGFRPERVKFRVTASGYHVDGWTEDGDNSYKEVSVTGNKTENTWKNSELTGLPVYDDAGAKITYTVSEPEDAALEKYTKSADVTATLTVDKNTTADAITNTYEPVYGKITVNKTWDDENNKAGMREATKVYLLADGKEVAGVEPKDITTADTSSVEWTNLPVYSKGEQIKYTVQEATVKGYTTKYETNPVTIDPDIKEGTIAIENKYEPSYSGLTIKKIWEDEDNVDGYRADSLEVTVSAEFADGAAANVFDDGKASTKTVTLTGTGNTWTEAVLAADKELPAEKDGKQVFYIVTNETFNGGVQSQYTHSCIERTAAGEYTITNIHEQDTTTVTITKVWSDNNNAYNTRPATVEMTLYKSVDGGDAVATDTKLILSAADVTKANTWTGSVSGLPTHELVRGVSKEVTYSWKEETVPDGYTAASQTAENEGTITNTVAGINVNATKKWAGETDATGTDFRSAVKLHLYGKVNDKVVVDAGIKEVAANATEDLNGTAPAVTWEGLPTHYQGTKIDDWTIEEEAIPGYTPTITGDAEHGFEITNTFRPVTTVKVSKEWDDGNNRDNSRPTSITYKLIPSDTSALDEDYDLEKTVKEQDDWQAEWTGLPVVSADGKTAITYTVEETQVNGYEEPVVLATATPGEFKVVNKRSVDTIEVKAEKTWAGDAEDNRPDHVVYSISPALDADGKTISPIVALSSDDYAATFTNLPKHDEEGEEIEYTITETPVTGYSTTYTDNNVKGSDGTVKVTNTAITGKLKVVKSWDDMDDHDGLRSAAIAALPGALTFKADGKTVTLTQDGNPVTDDDADTTTINYKDVPIYNANGQKIIYTVTEDESALRGYELSVSAGDANADTDVAGTLTLTNKHVPESKDVTITGKKVWIDPDPQAHNNSADITLKVERSVDGTNWTGLSEDKDYHIDWTTEESKDDTFTIRGLTRYVDADSAEKTEYQYRVTEEPVSGYTTKYKDSDTATSLDKEGGKITNIINQDAVTVKVTKVWVGEATDDITVSLNADGTEVATHKILKTASGDELSYTFEKDGEDNSGEALPKYDLDSTSENYGKEITYTVTEAPDGTAADAKFTSQISGNAKDGFVITNTSTETTTVYAQKQWAGDNDAKDNRSDVQFRLIQTIDGASKPVDDYEAVVDGETKTIGGTQNISADTTADAGTDAGTVNWPNLPKFDASGKAITYTVEEVSEPAGYTKSGPEGSGEEDDPYIITNTLNGNSINIPVIVKWNDANDQDAIRPANTEAKLQQYVDTDGDGVPDTWQDVAGQTLTLSDENNWTGSFNDLPKTDENGKDIEYRVVETRTDVLTGTDGAGTYAIDEAGDTTNPASGFVITNIHTADVTAVYAMKIWDDANGGSEDQHTDVILHLYGKIGGLVVYDAGTKKISKDAAGEVVSWTDIPKKHFDNTDLTWEVVEEAVPGYTSQVYGAGTQEDPYVVTNVYTGPLTEVSVSKEWQDNENVDKTRPAAITFELWSKTGTDEAEKVKEQEVPVAADGTAKYNWTDLPATKEVEDGTESVVRTEYQDVTKYRNKNNAEDVIEESAYESLPDKAKGDYIYDDTQDKYVNIYDDSDVITPDAYDALDEGAGKVDYEEFIDQVATDVTEDVAVMKEVPVIYFVKEQTVEGYDEPVIASTDAGVFKAINTRTQDVQAVTVTKQWNDANNAGGARPDHIGVVLKDGNTEVAREIMTGGMTDDEWTITFSDLPVNKLVNGVSTPITYTADEPDVPAGYGKSLDGLLVINTHTVTEPVTVKIVKKWADENGDTSAREKLTFHLIQLVDGASKEVGEAQTIDVDESLTEQNLTWPGTWPTEVDGKAATYTVEEDAIEGYTTVKDDGKWDASNTTLTITFTNTKKPGPEQITVTYKDADAFDGKVLQGPDTINRDAVEPEAPADPSHAGYTFTGWQRTEAENGNVVYTATYAENPDPAENEKFKVTFLDPKATDGSMILKATRYDSQDAADQAADALTGKPDDPSHNGYDFVGWALNKDEFGDYIIVAKYDDKITSPIRYYDGQGGTFSDKEFTPGADGLSFAGWTEMVDSDGNVIGYVAKWTSDCRNGGNNGGNKGDSGDGDSNGGSGNGDNNGGSGNGDGNGGSGNGDNNGGSGSGNGDGSGSGDNGNGLNPGNNSGSNSGNNGNSAAGGASSGNTTGKSPRTGDANNALIWVIVALAAAIAITGLETRRRRTNR